MLDEEVGERMLDDEEEEFGEEVTPDEDAERDDGQPAQSDDGQPEQTDDGQSAQSGNVQPVTDEASEIEMTVDADEAMRKVMRIATLLGARPTSPVNPPRSRDSPRTELPPSSPPSYVDSDHNIADHDQHMADHVAPRHSEHRGLSAGEGVGKEALGFQERRPKASGA